ncbi:MAG TPA: ABC transporter substrate-binding protein [Acidimicrobiales bacterium]|nr:ABC transporter substrate-binding protein [Acidimicrobiales bacterium]
MFGLVLIAAACTDGEREGRGGREGAEPVRGGRLVDLHNFSQGDPDHIDPALASRVEGMQVTHLVFDGLTESDPRTGELRPMVAESWQSNEDATVWTFKLRRGVRFHNGDRVLPSDFKFAWERVVRKELGSKLGYHFDPIVGKKEVDAGLATELRGVSADDEQMELTVELEFPYAIFPTTTAHTVFSPVPRRALETLPDQGRWEDGIMVGNGPFVMKEAWQRGRSVTLARNADYWGGIAGHPPYVDEVEFRISKDVDSAFVDFQAGNGHTARIPPGRFAEVLARSRQRVITAPVLGVNYWAFNMRDPVVGGPGNKTLREAIALAVDRQAIVDVVHNGSRKVATAFTPPSMPGYRPGLDEETGRDVEGARNRLRQHGRPVPRLTLSFNAGAGQEPVAAIIQANLKEVGIDTELDAREPSTYLPFIREGAGQLFRAAWVADYVAYDNFLYPLFHSASIGADNVVLYSSPTVDDLVGRARRTLDEVERHRLYQEAERMVLEDQAVLPLNWLAGQVVYAEPVRNLEQRPLQFLAYDEMWLQGGRDSR